MAEGIINDDPTQNKSSLSRRDFIKGAPIVTASILAAIFSNGYELANAEFNIPEYKERFLATDPNGNKLGLVLGNHGARGEINGRETVIQDRDLFLPMGALFMDSPSNFDPRINGDVVLKAINEARKLWPNFCEVPFKHALDNNIPIVFGDIELFGMSRDDFIDKYGNPGKTSLELALASLVSKVGEILVENNPSFYNRPMTRRDFLKLITGGFALGALYYATPAMAHVVRSLGIQPDSIQARDMQTFFSDLVHPDNATIVMRNIIWAEKCRDMYDKGIIDNQKVINILGGAGHRFCDYFFRYPDVGKKYWDTFGYKKIVNEISSGNPEWVYKSMMYKAKDNSLKIIEHESMRRFIE